MQVEIWSDVVCPWCYIGKRRFEAALTEFADRDQVEVVWRSYQLSPEAPRHYDGSLLDVLTAKFGHRSTAEQANQRVTAEAATVGLDFHLDNARPGNTLDAHRLLHHAAQVDPGGALQGALKERLMRGYFVEGEAIGKTEALQRLAVDAGLDAASTARVLASDEYVEDVKDDQQDAAHLGVRGVPFFVIDRAYGISGAQPSPVIAETLAAAWQQGAVTPTS